MVVIEERYPLIDKIWRWPLLLLFSARFLAICVKNCSTVPKLKTILQFHCRHTIANSLCCKSLACAQTPPPTSPQQKSIFTERRRGLYTGYKSLVNKKVELQSLWGRDANPPFVISPPYGPETQGRRLFLKTSFPGSFTGSRGDVFVVRTSKAVENLWKNGLFWLRYSFVKHSIDRKPRDWGLARSAYSIKYGHPSGDVPCASEDMACGYWFSKWRTTKSIWVR